MREELIPEIEQRYRTNGDRTFIGYSLGGLFGVYAMLSSPETFGRMILVRPSLWWDDNLLLKSEAEFAAGHNRFRFGSSCPTPNSKGRWPGRCC